ncbi:beta family protein [Paenibacillus sp. FSL K6-2524]|uniref:beta family protein n=1 Tax=Paenibacillus sp. FSL K6-2524 TaxID=2954516 RepID=UPI0030F8BC94
MYCPIMKNRDEELRVLKDMNNYFGDSITPIIEVIKDEYLIRYKTDEVTGKYIFEKKPGNKNRSKIELDPHEEDIITLKGIEERHKGKKAFVDFFRFSEKEYDNKGFKGIELSFKLSRDYTYYKQRVLQIGHFKNLIPVISIKNGFKVSERELLEFINELRKENPSIAIRITDNLIEDYLEVLEDNLTMEDYLMLDIRSQHVDSKFIELEEFQEMETKASKILLNSPRSRSYKNGNYENLDYTNKIDNKVAVLYKNYGFQGFGDFGGLKDDLPSNSGGNGKGAALGLLFVKEENAFYSIVNNDTNMGVSGYNYVRTEILKRLDFLDKEDNCVVIKRIKDMKIKFGSWATWNNITLSRYIHQQSRK